MNEKKEQTKRDIRDALFIDCPIRNVLARVGDKWSLLVLYNLQHKEPMRFKELQPERRTNNKGHNYEKATAKKP